jgi:hypothetical protein
VGKGNIGQLEEAGNNRTERLVSEGKKETVGRSTYGGRGGAAGYVCSNRGLNPGLNPTRWDSWEE